MKASNTNRRTISKSRVWAFSILAITGSALLTVILVDLALYFLAPVPFHEWMEWIPDGHIKGRAKPHQSFMSGTGHRETGSVKPDGTPNVLYEVRINNMGFRGHDYAWKPSPGTLRIAVFGGSAAFCYHNREEDSWPGKLQYYIQKRLEMPVEVLNLGLPGFDSSNSKINYLFAGRQLHPHVAIFYQTWNDMKFLRPLVRDPECVVFAGVATNKPIWERLARKSQICRRVRNFMLMNAKGYNENRYTSLEREGIDADFPVKPAAFAWARKNFSDFVMMAQSDNVLPVLVSQATIVSHENVAREEYRREMGSEMVGMTPRIILDTWLKMNDIIRNVAELGSACFVDGYSAVPKDFFHLEDHVHLTEKGCDVLASHIAGELMKEPRFLKIANSIRNENGDDSLGEK